MALPESVLQKPAYSRYAIHVIGGDAVFLLDRPLGQKLYMGAGKPQSRPELRRYVDALNNDLRSLTVGEFLTKYSLQG